MISGNVTRWYENMLFKAATLGQLSDVPRYKIGAILVFRKSVISTGFNKKKSHPIQFKFNQFRVEYKRKSSFVHAETDCLSPLREVPKGSTLFIGRFDSKGNPALCKPCEACAEFIRLNSVQEVVYHTNGGFAVEFLKGNI